MGSRQRRQERSVEVAGFGLVTVWLPQKYGVLCDRASHLDFIGQTSQIRSAIVLSLGEKIYQETRMKLQASHLHQAIVSQLHVGRGVQKRSSFRAQGFPNMSCDLAVEGLLEEEGMVVLSHELRLVRLLGCRQSYASCQGESLSPGLHRRHTTHSLISSLLCLLSSLFAVI